MNHAGIWRAIEASQQRMMLLADDLADLQARLPATGADASPEELVLVAEIAAEAAETKRLATLLRARMQRRLWLGISGMALAGLVFVALVLWIGR